MRDHLSANGWGGQTDSFGAETLDKYSYVRKLRSAQLTHFLRVSFWGQGKMAWRKSLPLRNQKWLRLKIQCAIFCLFWIQLNPSSGLAWGRCTSPARPAGNTRTFCVTLGSCLMKTPATSFWAETLQSYCFNLRHVVDTIYKTCQYFLVGMHIDKHLITSLNYHLNSFLYTVCTKPHWQ